MNLISLSNGPLAEALLTNRFRAFRFSAGPWRRSGSFLPSTGCWRKPELKRVWRSGEHRQSKPQAA